MRVKMSGAVPAKTHRQMVKVKCVHVQITLVKKTKKIFSLQIGVCPTSLWLTGPGHRNDKFG